MRAATPKNPLRLFRTERYREHGYWFDAITLYEGASVETIDEAIAHCREPGYYQSAEVGERQLQKMERLRAEGVSHVFDMHGVCRVRMVFQEYSEAPQTWCEANVELPSTPRIVNGSVKLWERLGKRMDKLQSAHRWRSFDLALQAAGQVCDARIQLYKSDPDRIFEYVLTTAA